MTKLRVDSEGSVDPGWGKIVALKDVFKDSPWVVDTTISKALTSPQ